MKFLPSRNALAAAFLAAIVVPPVSLQAEPLKKDQEPLRSVPFRNFWDAKAWDRGGALPFWHGQRNRKVTPPRGEKKETKDFEKENRTSPRKPDSNR